ncbi:hypothetical protein BJX76DRAFT_340180 [Aspergillus varians]
MEIAPSQTARPQQYAPPSTESCVASEDLSRHDTMLAAGHTTNATGTRPYPGPTQLLSLARELHDALTSRMTERQILLFQPVSPKEFTTLLSHIQHHCGILKLDYNDLSQLLVVKIVPGWDHEYTTALLRKLIDKQLATMNLDDEYNSLASPLVPLHHGSKQPDACWIPNSSPRRPTCVVEVGTSESRECLAIDAHRWLEASDTCIKTVVTISFKYLEAETHENPLTISIWELGSQRHNMITRSSYPHARPATTLNICRRNGLLSVLGSHLDPLTLVETETDEIRLPLDALIGRPPVNSGEKDVVLTKNMVLKMFDELLQSRTSEY